jgi:hypothetical protein
MALLNGRRDGTPRARRGRRRLNGALALLGLASITGCFVLEVLGLREPPLEFSHALHLEQGLDCASCHATYEDGDEPTWPTAGQCMLCHAETDEGLAPERQVASLFAGDAFRPRHVSAVSDEVIFSHATHLEAGASCEQCHTGIESAEVVDEALAVSMDDCMSCHAALNVDAGQECATCHTEMDLDTPPPNHLREWTRLHGLAVRAGMQGPADDCFMCHTEQSCTSCHQDTEPANHNNMFRLRTHGVVAAMDRDNCAACHTPDSCERCHAEVLPLSHRGTFGSPLSTHCLSCHEPLKNESCFTCHKSTPSHLMAAPLPSVPPHSPALDCRACHGVTASLPHVDNGDDCLSCHM